MPTKHLDPPGAPRVASERKPVNVRPHIFRRLAIALSLLCACIAPKASASSSVQLLRTPNGGIQPQAVVDAQGTVHLIYFKGEPQHGDLFYVKRGPSDASFSQPVQVNSAPGSAVAIGTIRGGQLALGKNGRVHVVWNGSDRAANATNHEWGGVIYTRLNDSGAAFEPERDLITSTTGVDGGSSVAADSAGHVYITWHAARPGNTNGEIARTVFIRSSNDDGQSFAPERPVWNKPLGACGCCGMRTASSDGGLVYILFRTATAVTNRDEVLLFSRNYGNSFAKVHQAPWDTSTCPMSSASLAPMRGGTLAAWETAGQVYFGRLTALLGSVPASISPPGKGSRKHPAVTQNARGEVLLAWTEGTGWDRGGSVAWQVFESDGSPTGEKGKATGVPVWGLVTAYAKPDGTFVVVY